MVINGINGFFLCLQASLSGSLILILAIGIQGQPQRQQQFFQDYDYQDFDQDPRSFQAQPQRGQLTSRRTQVGRGEAIPRDQELQERPTTPKTVAIITQINE